MSSEGNATLVQAIKDLRRNWEAVKEHWRDVKSEEFEQKYLDRLPGLTSRTSLAMDDVEALIRKVKLDCE